MSRAYIERGKASMSQMQNAFHGLGSKPDKHIANNLPEKELYDRNRTIHLKHGNDLSEEESLSKWLDGVLNESADNDEVDDVEAKAGFDEDRNDRTYGRFNQEDEKKEEHFAPSSDRFTISNRKTSLSDWSEGAFGSSKAFREYVNQRQHTLERSAKGKDLDQLHRNFRSSKFFDETDNQNRVGPQKELYQVGQNENRNEEKEHSRLMTSHLSGKDKITLSSSVVTSLMYVTRKNGIKSATRVQANAEQEQNNPVPHPDRRLQERETSAERGDGVTASHERESIFRKENQKRSKSTHVSASGSGELAKDVEESISLSNWLEHSLASSSHESTPRSNNTTPPTCDSGKKEDYSAAFVQESACSSSLSSSGGSYESATFSGDEEDEIDITFRETPEERHKRRSPFDLARFDPSTQRVKENYKNGSPSSIYSEHLFRSPRRRVVPKPSHATVLSRTSVKSPGANVRNNTSSYSSQRIKSSRPLTIPQGPTLQTMMRSMVRRPRYDPLLPRILDQPQVPRIRSTKPLTVPRGPRLLLDAKYGEKGDISNGRKRHSTNAELTTPYDRRSSSHFKSAYQTGM